jgi:hypothetical protein
MNSVHSYVKKEIPLEFSNLFIIESLDDRDFKSGRQLFNELWNPEQESKWFSRISFTTVESAKEFLKYVEDLTIWTKKTQLRPWLHLECHASAISGLYFSNGSELGWDELCEILRPLNQASNFNLMFGASACYGSHIAQAIKLDQPAPCYGAIGPTHDISPSDLLGHFRDFYRVALTSMNLDDAIETWQKRTMSEGMMAVIFAEQWWTDILFDLIRDAASPSKFSESVRTTFKRLKAAQIDARLGKVKRAHISNFSDQIFRSFDSYFLIDSIPESAQRFLYIKEALRKSLADAIRKMQRLKP